jgi:hypothetical protein
MHAVLVRGYMTVWYGDYGLWLDQVERFAHGERLYVDFYFAAPPLAIWIVGSLARVVGTDLPAIFTIMTAVFLATVIAFWLFVVRWMPAAGPVVVVVAITGFILAVATATIGSSPWPLGMYSPAVPIGALSLFTSLALTPPLLEGGGWWRAALVGAVAGLCIPAKQDFWLPAIVLVSFVSVVRWRFHDDRASPLIVMGVFAATVGAAALATTSSPTMLIKIATGFGQSSSGLARAIPSWQLLTVEAMVTALLGIWVLICLRLAGLRTTRGRLSLTLALLAVVVLFLGTEFVRHTGAFEFRALQLLRDYAYRHALPVFLPFVVLGAAVRRRRHATDDRLRTLVIGLGAVAAAARFRRGFEHVEWYYFLLELPLYTMALQLHFGDRGRRASAIAALGFVVIGVHMFWKFGMGPLTLSGSHAATLTPRGTVRWEPRRVAEFLELQRILAERDPAGDRPVFKFGDNGGINYFLRRPVDTSITQGFLLVTEPEGALQHLIAIRPSLFVIYDHVFDDPRTHARRFEWRQWTKPLEINPLTMEERAYFARLLEGCFKLPPSVALEALTIYDCKAQ